MMATHTCAAHSHLGHLLSTNQIIAVLRKITGDGRHNDKYAESFLFLASSAFFAETFLCFNVSNACRLPTPCLLTLVSLMQYLDPGWFNEPFFFMHKKNKINIQGATNILTTNSAGHGKSVVFVAAWKLIRVLLITISDIYYQQIRLSLS